MGFLRQSIASSASMKLFPMFLTALVCVLTSLGQGHAEEALWQAEINTDVGTYSPGSGSTLSKIRKTAAFNADASKRSSHLWRWPDRVTLRSDQWTDGPERQPRQYRQSYRELGYGTVANVVHRNPPNLVAGSLVIDANYSS
jgi:hypothetical protein